MTLIKFRDDKGIYRNPITGKTYVGVSTFKNSLSGSSGGLNDWARNMSVQRAQEVIQWLRHSTDRPEGLTKEMLESDEKLSAWIARASLDITSRSSDNGTALHAWADPWDPEKPLPTEVTDEYPNADLRTVGAMIQHLLTLVDRWQIKFHAQERTVSNERLGTAGTLDGLISSPFLPQPHLWYVADTKTTNSVKPRFEVAMQLYPYASSDSMWDDEGNMSPMPAVSQEHAYVIKVKEYGAWLHRVDFRYKRGDVLVDIAQLAYDARNLYTWQKKGHLLVSDKISPPATFTVEELESRISRAASEDALTTLWQTAMLEGIWTEDLTALARTRVLELRSNN